MPDRMQRVLEKAWLPFSKAIAAIRREIENSFLVRKIASYPLGERLLKDTIFRSGVSLHVSLSLNFVYGAMQFLAGIYSRSVWLGALAVYHILLAAMQFMLLSHVNKKGVGQDDAAELRQYRLCGVALLLMTPIFASILILIVHKNSHAGYPGFLIYFAAIYAFCKIASAVSNAIKFKKCGSPVMSAAKIIRLISALISILSLETAILSRYGGMQNPVFYQGMLGTVGGAVCVFVLSKAVSMVIQATRQAQRSMRCKETPDGGLHYEQKKS